MHGDEGERVAVEVLPVLGQARANTTKPTGCRSRGQGAVKDGP